MKLHKVLIKFLSIAIFITALSVVFLSITYAQNESDNIAAKYGITFPISELGNCKDLSSCRVYCEDLVNKDSCIAFAKNKGFYKEDVAQTKKEETLAIAKVELGCSSYESCMAFCQDFSNFDKCGAFAKRNNLGGGHVASPEEEKLLEKAKAVLGCDSPSSCMSFCNDPSNRDKCSEFAKQVGIRGGHTNTGPGGCTSRETCQEFCSNPANYEVCSSYGKASGESFSGPGGCNSEESCREYCKTKPNECGFEQKGDSYSYPIHNPQETCNKTPNCSWTSNRCECNYEGSQEGNVRTQSPPTEYTAPTHTYDPSTECAKYPGCSWTGSSCQCSNQESDGDTQQTTQTTTDTQTQVPDTQNYTQPPDSEPYVPPSGVQGSKEARGILFMLIDSIRSFSISP